jgi:hypothetical protein
MSDDYAMEALRREFMTKQISWSFVALIHTEFKRLYSPGCNICFISARTIFAYLPSLREKKADDNNVGAFHGLVYTLSVRSSR